MKRLSVSVLVLVILFCFPVFAEETTEAISETNTQATTETTGATYRVDLDYTIAIPDNAAARGLNPYYKVESSFVDEAGETRYVCAGGKGIVLRDTECIVQNYIEINSDSEMRKTIIAKAMEKLGCGYAYGKSGPTVFDCSGFVCYCMSSVGVTVPRSSYAMCGMETKIDKSQLKAGDIVATKGHVGLYIGDGCFIHAQDHASGVVTDYLDIYNAKSYKKFKYYINILD